MSDQTQNIRTFFARYGEDGEGGSLPAGTATTITTSTTSGNTTDGLFAYSIVVTGGSNATIDGVSFADGSGVAVDGSGLPLDSISFDATGSAVRILEVAFI
ncbi:MAG: hypothetical protein JKY81_01725 [Colwellia sp.]|nr:hypothetical protein [Colwellia sp.]